MPVPVDLSQFSNVVKNVVKKDVYNAKIKTIEDTIPDITNSATNASLNAKINEIKGEIPNITKLSLNASLNDKINEVKGEIPNVTNLATNTALTAVENKTPNVSSLVKKTDSNTNVSEIGNKITDHDHDKYITNLEFNKFTAENFSARLKQTNLARKSDIANFVKKTDFDNKPKDVATDKSELNELLKKVKELSTKGLTKDLINKFSIFNEANYFTSGIF